MDGLDYRETAGDPLPTIPEPKALYLAARQGMATSDFSGVTLLLPKNAGLGELADQINSAWQKECSLFFSVEEVEQDEFDARIAAGKYTIALAPIRAEGGSAYQMLQQFTAEGGSLTGYADTVYADRLALSAQQTGKDRCALLAQCERQLLEVAPWCPDGAAETSAAGKRRAGLGIRPVLPGAGPDLGQNELTANFVRKSLDIPALLCYNNGALAGLAHPVERLLPKQ